MSNEMTIAEFIQAIEKLPYDEPREWWIHWLSEYNTPGYYHRKVTKGRSAGFAYNHIAHPRMLLWLIEAAGVQRDFVKLAKIDYKKTDELHKQSAAIRKHVPWKVLEVELRKRIAQEPTHWLQYWKPFQIKDAVTESWPLYFSAGDQLQKVNHGDIVWIISVEPPGKLITLGPINVRAKLNRQQAKEIIGPDIWPAAWYIFDYSEDIHGAKYVDLSPVISKLRFISEDSPQLVLKQGKVSGKQFQSMRKLDPASAKLITQLWQDTKSNAEIIAEKYEEELKNLESLDEERLTKTRREQGLLREILFGTAKEGKCGICGCTYPVSLLVAAHIKPRSKCPDKERRDIAHNLMPLCTLGCDSLFEKGYISIIDRCIIAGPNKANTLDLQEIIEDLVDLPCNYWTSENKKYFDWRARNPAQIID
jgi:hypothetical protein